jgi:hypothetical protein
MDEIENLFSKLSRKNEAEKKRKQEEQARKEAEEKEKKRLDHIESVTSMELPLDWENVFDSDKRTEGVHAESISDGLILSLSNLGTVDIEYISSITGADYKTVICALKGSIYQNPDKWDENQDGVLEGRQHHTLDMELFGPASWLQGFYLLALKCGAKMAKYLGDENRAKLYTKIFNSGKEWCNENLFNGEYFCQKVELANKEILEKFNAVEPYWNSEAKQIKYQIADGCMIDQMLSDWHAALIGEEGVFDKDKKRTALKSLYNYNFKSSMREVTNMWRNFALNDEGGTLICSYPDSAKTPAIPIPYCEETMTGFEYALAGLMIHEGFITEGESMVKAIRDRYDGEKRNPFNEIECGNNYARSMASYALMPIYSGFKFDMTKKHIGFAPLTTKGKYLFSVCQSWGTVSFDERSFSLSVMGEPLILNSISVPLKEIKEVTSDNEKIDFEFSNGTVYLKKLSIKKELKLS